MGGVARRGVALLEVGESRVMFRDKSQRNNAGTVIELCKPSCQLLDVSVLPGELL